MRPSREEICKDARVTSAEFMYPTATSKKKKWKIASKCDKCGERTAKWFQRSTWTFLCSKCSHGRRTTAEFIRVAIEQHGHELKIVVTPKVVKNFTKAIARSWEQVSMYQHFFLQPCADPDDNTHLHGMNIDETLKVLKRVGHPWRLSLQTHKLIGAR